MKYNSGYLYGLFAAFFWGFHAVLVRYLIPELPGIVIATARLYIATIAIYLFLKLVHPTFQFPRIKKRVFLTIAVFGVSLNFAFFHWGLEYTTASNAMLIESSAPIFVLIFLALFLKEKIKYLEVLGIIIGFSGVILVVLGDLQFDQTKLFGDSLELLAAATWAIFIIGSSKVAMQSGAPTGRLAYLMLVFLVAAISLTPALFTTSYVLTSSGILYLIALGLFPTALAYALWYEAATRISTISAALMFNLSIVFTLINAWFLLDEAITALMIVGTLLIVAAVVLTQMASKKAGMQD